MKMTMLLGESEWPSKPSLLAAECTLIPYCFCSMLTSCGECTLLLPECSLLVVNAHYFCHNARLFLKQKLNAQSSPCTPLQLAASCEMHNLMKPIVALKTEIITIKKMYFWDINAGQHIEELIPVELYRTHIEDTGI